MTKNTSSCKTTFLENTAEKAGKFMVDSVDKALKIILFILSTNNGIEQISDYPIEKL